MASSRLPVLIALLLAVMAGPAGYAQESRAKEQAKKEQPGNKDAAQEAPELNRKERKKLRREERRKEKEARQLQQERDERAREKAASAKTKRADKKQPTPDKPATPAKKKQEVLYPASKLKDSYRINVLIPLYLDELVRGESLTFKDKVPEKAAQGLAFYQGIKLAADSLKRAGYNLDIYINDVGSYSGSPENLISDKKLDSADLVIGAVQQHDIPAMAVFAKKKHINFVSALSPNDGYVKNNQYFTMLQPTIRSHCEYITDDMSKKYAGQKVALLYRTNTPNDDNAAQYLINDGYSEVTFTKLLCNTLPGKERLLTVLDTAKPNIVVVPTLDAGFADSLLRQLVRYFPGTHFEVYGMPTWSAIANLRKANAYTNLTINITCPFSFEQPANGGVQAAEQAYKKEFGGKAPEMAFRGYETLMWYAALLRRYGTIFNSSYKDNSGAPFTKFEVKTRRDSNGSLLYNENCHLFLSTYQAGVYKAD